MSNVRTIDFHGDRLLGFEDGRGIFIALRPMVQGMGLDWSAQYRRVMRDPILKEAVAMMATTPNDKEGVCLPLDLVPGFLFRIDAARVDEAIRSKVIDYQRSCFTTLARAFLKPAKEAEVIAAPIDDILPEQARKLVTEARHSFGILPARELWFRLGLPVVPSMRAVPAQGSLFTWSREG